MMAKKDDTISVELYAPRRPLLRLAGAMTSPCAAATPGRRPPNEPVSRWVRNMLACSLLPSWAAMLPLGPHFPSSMRVLIHNILATSHAEDENEASTGPS